MARRKRGATKAPGKTGQERRAEGQVIRIEFTALDATRANRRASRDEAIASGTLHANKGGVHGGSKRANRRQARSSSRLALRRGELD